jgi:hypothetical protein
MWLDMEAMQKVTRRTGSVEPQTSRRLEARPQVAVHVCAGFLPLLGTLKETEVRRFLNSNSISGQLSRLSPRRLLTSTRVPPIHRPVP